MCNRRLTFVKFQIENSGALSAVNYPSLDQLQYSAQTVRGQNMFNFK
jgi:hypothetical protein